MKKYVKFICVNSAKFIWIFSMTLSKKQLKKQLNNVIALIINFTLLNAS